MIARADSLMPYWVAMMNALSIAGAMMTVLALSASFIVDNQSGMASSAVQVCYYVGASVVGFFGGILLQRLSITRIAVAAPLISASIVFSLATMERVPPHIGLPAIFVIFVLSGINNPNTMRYYNALLPLQGKMPFFSLSEGLSYTLNIAGPLLAGWIIKEYGPRFCFIIDGITYLLVTIPWLYVRRQVKRGRLALPAPPQEPLWRSWFVGFRLLINNAQVKALVGSRMLNNMAFVTFTTSIPLVLARSTAGSGLTMEEFAVMQGSANSLAAAGFVGGSAFGFFLSRNMRIMLALIFMAPACGFMAHALLAGIQLDASLLYAAALLAGIGSYSFRISSMTLGQTYTPKEFLGPVIVAGDALVRSWSSVMSMSIVFLYQLPTYLEIAPSTHTALTLALPFCALTAPLLLMPLARSFANNRTG